MPATFSTKPISAAPEARRQRLPAQSARGRYDAAQTNDDNVRHWANADRLTAEAAINPEVRHVLSSRSQYEYDNNTYAKGIANTIANDVVGPTGPRLKVTTANGRAIAAAWSEWARSIDLAGKLRLMRIARIVRGEIFPKTFLNGRIIGGVELDFELIEGEQVAGIFGNYEENYADGIRYDTFGNAITYDVLKVRRGYLGVSTIGSDHDTISADYIYHYFKRDRAGQLRGIPEQTPALPLYAYQRRYTLATVAAAETAANHAGVFESSSSSEMEAAEEMKSFDLVDLERAGGLVVPKGYTLKQLTAEQPTSTFSDFHNKLIAEIARAMNVPFTIAALDSSKANMSAAYLDQMKYANARRIDRDELERFLDWVFAQWVAQARFTVPAVRELRGDIPHSWLWPSMGDHADPNKSASAVEKWLGMGLTSLDREYGEDGFDSQEELARVADSYGLDVKELQQLIVRKVFANGNPLDPTQAQKPAAQAGSQAE